MPALAATARRPITKDRGHMPINAACQRTKFDFDPGDICPECFTVRATTGACNCA